MHSNDIEILKLKDDEAVQRFLKHHQLIATIQQCATMLNEDGVDVTDIFPILIRLNREVTEKCLKGAPNAFTVKTAEVISFNAHRGAKWNK